MATSCRVLSCRPVTQQWSISRAPSPWRRFQAPIWREVLQNDACHSALLATAETEAELAQDSTGQTLTVREASGAVPPIEEEGDESRDFAVAMARLAADTKGQDISLLHVAPLVYWTRYMLLVTVFSRPQLGAIIGKMQKEAEERWDRTLGQQKQPGQGSWEVLDFGDVVVHAFTAEQREFYDLESFYGTAEEVELPFPTQSGSEDLAWQRKLT